MLVLVMRMIKDASGGPLRLLLLSAVITTHSSVSDKHRTKGVMTAHTHRDRHTHTHNTLTHTHSYDHITHTHTHIHTHHILFPVVHSIRCIYEVKDLH